MTSMVHVLLIPYSMQYCENLSLTYEDIYLGEKINEYKITWKGL